MRHVRPHDADELAAGPRGERAAAGCLGAVVLGWLAASAALMLAAARWLWLNG